MLDKINNQPSIFAQESGLKWVMIQIEQKIRKLFQEVENEDTKLQILENDLRENAWAEKEINPTN